jgi:hypothetical protein
MSRLLEVIEKAKTLMGKPVKVYSPNGEHKEYTLISYTQGFSFRVGNGKEDISINAILKSDEGKRYSKLPLENVINAIEDDQEIKLLP